MTEEEPLRQRYLRRFKIGAAFILLLAGPVAYFAMDAVHHLFNRPPDWVPNSIPEKAEFNEFLRRFSVAEIVMVSWDGAKLDSEQLDQASALLKPLCEESDSLELDPSKELPEWASEELASLRQICKSDKPLLWVHSGTEMLAQMTASPAKLPRSVAINRLSGSVVGPDGEQTCLVISMGEASLVHRRVFLPKLREVLGRLTGHGKFEIAMVGGPFEGATVDDESVRSVQTFSPPSAIFAAVLCLICLRSVPLTLVITVVAVLGEGFVLSLVSLSGTPMNAVLIVLPPLVFVLTVSSGIHLSNYYLDVAHEFPEMSRAAAAKRAMRAGVIPCLLATGTTVVGLGSLTLVRLEPIRIFGFVASAGVLATLLMLFAMLPGAMVLTQVKRPNGDDVSQSLQRRRFGIDAIVARLQCMIDWCVSKMRKRLTKPWPLLIGFAVIAAVLSTGLFKLETSVNVPRMFATESDIRVQYRWFEKYIGPTVNGEVLVSFPVPAQDDDPLERLEIVKQAHMAAIDHAKVDGALSALTFVPPVPSGHSLSSTAKRSVIRTLIRDPNSSLGRLGFISRDSEAEVWRISVRMPQSEHTDYSEELEEIKAAVVAGVADSKIPVKVVFTGSIAIVQKAQQVLLRDLFLSFLSAFGVVAVVMMILLRSFLGGLIAMIPNLFPTIALFGWMGIVELPLDIGSVMTASVALGIAVDDTIHLLSRFGSRRARGLGQIRAAWGSLGQCGWAMLQTTTVCGLSLMVYWFSDFVPTSRFAVLMFGLLTAALLGDLLLLPALMCSSLGRWLAKPLGADPGAELSSHDQPHFPTDARRLRRQVKVRS